MRVMCIDDNWFSNTEPGRWLSPKFGDIDIVINNITKFGRDYYILERFPESGFYIPCFIPVSDIEETQLAEVKESVCV